MVTCALGLAAVELNPVAIVEAGVPAKQFGLVSTAAAAAAAAVAASAAVP